MKLNIREACYTGIKSKTKVIKNTEKHKKLVIESNERIKAGNEKYAKAYENAKDYLKN